MKEFADKRRAMMSNAKASAHGTWEDLFRSIDAGTYTTDYAQGETLLLDLGDYGTVNMEISDFNYDVLASDITKRAPVTLVAKDLLFPSHRWNPALDGEEAPYTEGSGNIGGWERSELRAWLLENIFPLIPSKIRFRIVSVAKFSNGNTESGTRKNDFDSMDRIFVPSMRETGATQDAANRANVYSSLNSALKRKKHKVGSTAEGEWWWTRTGSVLNLLQSLAITPEGKNTAAANNQTATAAHGVCLCFCIG